MTADHDAIRARAEAATPGPWNVVSDIAAYTHPWEVVRAGSLPLIELEDTKQGCADAEFIAHARTDIPALLADRDALAAEVERLKAENAELDAEVQRLTKLTSMCSCDTGPWSTGPEADCPVHGAIQAHAQASKRIAELEVELTEAKEWAAKQGDFLARQQARVRELLNAPGDTP